MDKGFDTRMVTFLGVFVAILVLVAFFVFMVSVYISRSCTYNIYDFCIIGLVLVFIVSIFVVLYLSKSLVMFAITDEEIIIKTFEHFKIKQVVINKADIKLFHVEYIGGRCFYTYITIILKSGFKYYFEHGGMPYLAEYIVKNRKEIPNYTPEINEYCAYVKKLHNS